MKYYKFNGIGINLLSFQVNSEEFLTILENDTGYAAIYIDNSSDLKALRFIQSGSPLTYTSEDEN
jgi:hypothetical protein